MSPDRINISTTPMQKPLQISREDVVTEARKWLGVKWQHQGRGRAGIDCIGLVVRVGQDLGLPITDMQGYKRTPEAHKFLEHVREQSEFVSQPEPGCIGLFRERHFPCHIGIFSEKHGEIHLIHSYLPTGKVMEEHFAHQWINALVEVRKYKGLID